MRRTEKIVCRTVQTVFRAALPFLPYREPEILHRVSEIPRILQEHKIRSVLLVTDGELRCLGLTKELERALAMAKIRCGIYDRVTANPTIQQVEEARRVYLHCKAEAIIAFGGGSAIDCAKVTGARIACPKKQVHRMKGLLRIHRALPLLIAVPTTAGTGSETTLAAVITDSGRKHKYPINDFCLIPRYAVLDHRVTLGLPPKITATTGMDALTHAIEAYIGRSTTAETRWMAEHATGLIYRNLERAYRNGQDAEARENLLQAAHWAGIAFSRSYVGYVHAVAHSLGGEYGVPHGLANAVILPYFLEEYGSACRRKLARLARKSGIVTKHTSDRRAAEALLCWIKEMNQQMDIPTCISQLRQEDIPKLARHAASEGNPLYPVPVLMDAGELARMYGKIMEKGETDGTDCRETKTVFPQRKTHYTILPKSGTAAAGECHSES